MEAAVEERFDDLIARVADGDREALGQVYERTSGRVLGLVRRIVGDASESEDVVVAVFGEIWRTAPRVDEWSGRPLAWILALAHRHAVDRRRVLRGTDPRRPPDVGRSDRPGDDVCDRGPRHDAARVGRALGSLTPLQLLSIRLAYYEGRTVPELAWILGTTVDGAHAQVRDAMRRLREALRDDGPDTAAGGA